MEPPDRMPTERDVDVFGMTDQGKIRDGNQDQFLIASLHKHMEVWSTSLPNPDKLRLRSDAIAALFLVADGVGGHAGGQEASGKAVEAVVKYITHTMNCYYNYDVTMEPDFLSELQESVLRCHAIVSTEGARDPERKGMATTLTLVQVLWPHAYVVQVGDSRFYALKKDELVQVTKDQTIAQDLIDRGVPREDVEGTRLDHMLSSAIGGEVHPVTTRIDLEWDDVIMLCTDGLTKHVSDDEIRDRLASRSSAEEMCRDLIGTALDRGGTDNVTVIVARMREPS